MLLPVFKKSVKESFRFWRIAPWILLAVASWGAAIFVRTVSSSDSKVTQYAIATAFISLHIVALAAAVFSASILSAEVEQKTIVYLLTRPIARWVLLLGRWLGTTCAVIVVGWLSVAAAGLGVYGPSFVGQAAFQRDLIGVALGAAAYTSVFMLSSMFVNRAMLLNLLLAFGWELSVPALPGSAYRLSIFTYMFNIHLGPTREGASRFPDFLSGLVQGDPMSLWYCAGILLAVCAVAVGISLVWFSVFEYLPKEQGA